MQPMTVNIDRSEDWAMADLNNLINVARSDLDKESERIVEWAFEQGNVETNITRLNHSSKALEKISGLDAGSDDWIQLGKQAEDSILEFNKCHYADGSRLKVPEGAIVNLVNTVILLNTVIMRGENKHLNGDAFKEMLKCNPPAALAGSDHLQKIKEDIDNKLAEAHKLLQKVEMCTRELRNTVTAYENMKAVMEQLATNKSTAGGSV